MAFALTLVSCGDRSEGGLRAEEGHGTTTRQWWRLCTVCLLWHHLCFTSRVLSLRESQSEVTW